MDCDSSQPSLASDLAMPLFSWTGLLQISLLVVAEIVCLGSAFSCIVALFMVARCSRHSFLLSYFFLDFFQSVGHGDLFDSYKFG